MQNNSIVAETENSVPTAIQIQESLGQIYDIIDKVGQHLEKTFHNQEDRFLEEYRKQMYSAQRNLREYTKTHSQAELTKKIEEKERALRAERERSLNETIQRSNKIKDLKTHANNLKQSANNLEDEINFIDDQAVLSEEKNRRLNEESNFLKLEILKLKPDFEFWEENPQEENSTDLRVDVSNNKATMRGNNSYSLMNSVDLGRKGKSQTYKTTNKRKIEGWRDFDPRPIDGMIDEGEMERMRKQYNFESHNFEALSKMNEDSAFMKNKFEEIFEDCIIKTLEKNAEKLISGPYSKSGKLPLVSRSMDGAIPNEEEISQAETNVNFEKLKLAEMNITEHDKKNMMEEFMTNKDVKDYFYKKFTEEPPKKPKARMF